MSQDEATRPVVLNDGDAAEVMRLMEQERRNMAGEFLIRAKGHLDRLAKAGLDTRIVRELVTLHTLAVMACDSMGLPGGRRGIDSDHVMEVVNVASFFEALHMPTTAGEAAFFAERADVGTITDDPAEPVARLVTVAREVCAYERPLEDLADVLADMGEDTTPEGGST